jgi:transposase
MYHVDRKGFKTIARELRLSKNTVKKVIHKDVTKHIYVRSKQSYPTLGNYLSVLIEKLEFDQSEPKRRKRKAKKLYNELFDLGYRGSYEAVNNYIKKWRLEKANQGSKEVFIPLEFDPGEAFQFDWSTEEIELAGHIVRIKAAHIRLSYSRFFLVVAFPNEQLEMVMEAHNHAFEFFDGVCRKGIYDNMKTAIQKVLVGKDRIFNKRFLQLSSHYLFEPIACTPAAGWEKGQVENQVSTSRNNFFNPLVRVNSLNELNEQLRGKCIEWAKKTKHPTIRDKTTWDVYQEEKPFLLEKQRRLDAFKVNPTTVSAYSLVQYDTNSYSVNCEYVDEAVEIQIYADKLVVIYKGKIIGKHKRCFGKNKRIYNPWHYVSALERKPGALRNGAPFKQLELPDAVKKIQHKQSKYSDGDKRFIQLLLKANKYGLDKLEKACCLALNQGMSNADWIIDKMKDYKEDEETKKAKSNKRKGNERKTNKILKINNPANEDCSEYNQMLIVTIPSCHLIDVQTLKGGHHAI